MYRTPFEMQQQFTGGTEVCFTSRTVKVIFTIPQVFNSSVFRRKVYAALVAVVMILITAEMVHKISVGGEVFFALVAVEVLRITTIMV
jgi:hypothetical protein